MFYVLNSSSRVVFLSLDRDEAERKAEMLNMGSDTDSFRVTQD